MSRHPPLLRERDFALYWVANLTRVLPMQMIAVAVGWQVYAVRHHPFDIGLVGLAEFVPLPLLALPTGQLADRISRRFVVALSLVVRSSIRCCSWPSRSAVRVACGRSSHWGS